MSARQEELRNHIEEAIERALKEWDLTYYDVVGVLTCCCHDLMLPSREDDDE